MDAGVAMEKSGGAGLARLAPWAFWRRQSFLLRFALVFALIALAASLVAGFIVSNFLASDIRQKTLDDVALDVSQNTARIIAPRLTPEDLSAPMAGTSFQEFDAFIRGSVLSPRILRVNVWNPQGTIVYSTSPPLHGKTLASEGLEAALAGATGADVEDTRKGVEGGGLEGYQQVVEVYTPLIFAGSMEPAGAFEIYRDYGPVAAHIRDVQKSVYMGIGAALGFVYLTLLLVVKGGSNLIRRQQQDLEVRSQELRSSYDSIVSVLCAALDLRDHVTSGHARRVSELARVVAWQMGLRKEQVRYIRQAGILHDIGKIGVADAVLSKPGALAPEEWEEMRRHPELGYEILKGMEFLKDAAEIVYAHHERYDGGGYPRGLRGDAIPLGARIFAVVDAYDAMTSHRPYRRAVSHQEAVEEVLRQSSSQFDPQVVRAFQEAERRGLIQGHREVPEDVEAFLAQVTGQARAEGAVQPSPPESL